jgi:serine/threonine protein phosphatase PrpC
MISPNHQREDSEIRITTANVGDSRIVLGQRPPNHPFAEPALAIRLTVDHRTDDPLEVARIEQAGGFLFKGRVCGVLAVTRSLGDQILKPYVTAHPAVREIGVRAAATADHNNNSFLIVACDGLWDVMTDQEAVQLVESYCGNDKSKQATVADCLVAEALRRGTADNVTAVVVWL